MREKMQTYYTITKYTILIALLLPLWTGCKKEPINRDIEGHWKLEQFTILESNEVVKCERIFWGITRLGAKMFEKQGSHNYETLEAKFEYADDETVLIFKDIVIDYTKAKPTIEQLLPFGLNNSVKTEFHIVESGHRSMTLQSDYARLQFKKF